jgi:hypothetical protein
MEKYRFKQLLESTMGNVKPLVSEEKNWKNFLMRRVDIIDDEIDFELKLSVGLCSFKKDNNFDGYLDYFSRHIAKNIYQHSGLQISITSYQDDLPSIANFIKNYVEDKLKTYFKQTRC